MSSVVMKTSNHSLFEELFAYAGITINGNAPWDLKIHNPKFFRRVLLQQELGLGEAYMDGWWDCPRLDEFFFRLLRARLDTHLNEKIVKSTKIISVGLGWLLRELEYRLINFQNKSRAFEVGKRHYDIGNDLFSLMLDKELNYTCGYWKESRDLDAAQVSKLKLICDKLRLQPGQRILDIGCGWGSFARYAAKNYGVEVVGITISEEQKELAEKLCFGLPIKIRLQDYRDVKETFDYIISIGMFEHVGYKNYATYLDVARQSLKDDGLFLLHTIGSNITLTSSNRWISKYIFPNGMIPSLAQISKACEKRFIIEDVHNFGSDYDKTLMAWHHNFNLHWDSLKNNYDERFKRMWNYYLLCCAGAFRCRDLQLWQIVLSKQGLIGGYNSIR